MLVIFTEREGRETPAHLAVVVIEGTEAREAGGARGGRVGQAQHLQSPVGPDVGQAVVAVVRRGEHVQVEGRLVGEEDLAEVNRDVGDTLDILVAIVVVQGNFLTLLLGVPVRVRVVVVIVGEERIIAPSSVS